jgi:flavin-dependent dehydrogenase
MYDLIVVGAGPSGVACSSYIAKEGYKVLLIEQSEFPRFRIGESLLPFSMEIFNDLGFDQVLDAGEYLRKNGALFISSKDEKSVYFDFSDGGKAQFPFSYEVSRSLFDKDFLEHAKSLGVEVSQPEEYKSCNISSDLVTVTTNKKEYKSKFIIDATGGKSLIINKFEKKTKNELYSNNFSIYAHFKDVENNRIKDQGDITIGLLLNQAWSWVIPFKDGSTSVGIVFSKEDINKVKNKEELFNKIIGENTWLENIMKDSVRSTDYMISSNYSYKCEKFYGERWASVGDAMSFLDPVFSSGVHIGLYSAKLISKNILHSLMDENILLNSANNIVDYNNEILKGVSRFNSLLQMFYGPNFIERITTLEKKPKTMSSMISAVAGGVWDDNNTLFRMGIL